ncbi:AraC family transcriptional regulator [Paenibacillus tarimensis]
MAFECGFNSVRTFNRAFREIRGGTPSQIKRARVIPYNRLEGDSLQHNQIQV